MAAVYTAHTSPIRIFNSLYFPNVTFKTYVKWRADTISLSQIDCTQLDSQMREGKHQTGASRDRRPRQLTIRWRPEGDDTQSYCHF